MLHTIYSELCRLYLKKIYEMFTIYNYISFVNKTDVDLWDFKILLNCLETVKTTHVAYSVIGDKRVKRIAVIRLVSCLPHLCST